MPKTVIKFEDVTKKYKLYQNNIQRVLAIFFRNVPYKTKKAVNNVSFEVKNGETIAIFGKNGAGKSTLLKMIAQVSYPTSGKIKVKGRVGALLELTSGLEADFTGRENIYFKGQLLGFTKKQIKELEEEIIEFSELGDYIDQPFRTYSSGMKARLGFSINISVKPEILIIDEALSVGDEEFRRKCIKKINELVKKDKVTLLYVTHATNTALDFCRRGIVMQRGKIIFDGEIKEAIKIYENTLEKK